MFLSYFTFLRYSLVELHLKKKTLLIECPSGYYKSNCSETCVFPSFGDDCQNICNCDLSLCDHIFGCKETTGKKCYLLDF